MNKEPQKYTLDQIKLQSSRQFNSLFSPTTEMAAELMNVPVSVVEEWLEQELLIVNGDNSLSETAIDFLAAKYVSRTHRYFDNCVASWDTLDPKERTLFSQFKRKYGKFFRFRIDEWKDIDAKRIAADFKAELEEMGLNDFLDGFGSFPFRAVAISEPNRIDADLILSLSLERSQRSVILFSISHSLYFGSHLKTRIPAAPGHRDIVLEILQENRFHIFTGESEDNVQIDAISLLFNVNQPQLAIVPVFGYQRRQNNYSHEYHYKNKTHLGCPA